MGSIKADYAKATLAARDEYTDAQIALADMPKKTLEYREQCERVDSLRDMFIRRVVSFIYDESRREQPRMWSALYLALLDMRKLSPQDWISYYSNTIIRSLLRALEWDREPIGDDKLFTCDDFYKYVDLHSRLYAEARFIPGLPKIVGILNGVGVAAQNADTITRHVVSAATTKCDDARAYGNTCNYSRTSMPVKRTSRSIFSPHPARNIADRRSSRACASGHKSVSEPACVPPLKQPTPTLSWKQRRGGAMLSPPT